jgi:hypothetical protein
MPGNQKVAGLSDRRPLDMLLRTWYSQRMLHYQMPAYFFAGAMCYLFPEALSWLVVVYLGLVVLRH